MTEAIVARLRAAGCVFAEDEAGLLTAAAATDAGELERLVRARVAGEPLEQLLGWASFCGRRIVVAPGVFVPRRRTEFLAELALTRSAPDAVVLDLCCGTGALGAVLDGRDVHAVDVDPAAVQCARTNLPRGHVYAGDLYAPLPDALRGRVDLIAANAPYVPTEAIPLMPPEARDFEPQTALDGGRDGLDVQRRLIATAPTWLTPQGQLLVETSRAQAPTTAALFAVAGFAAEIASDPTRDATVVLGSLALAPSSVNSGGEK